MPDRELFDLVHAHYVLITRAFALRGLPVHTSTPCSLSLLALLLLLLTYDVPGELLQWAAQRLNANAQLQLRSHMVLEFLQCFLQGRVLHEHQECRVDERLEERHGLHTVH